MVECATEKSLAALVRSALDIFTQAGGVLLLLYSVVHTRGAQRVWEDAGNSSKLAAVVTAPEEETAAGVFQTLVMVVGEGWLFCEQCLVNLLLTGHAFPDLEPKDKCAIGFLTYTENLRPGDVTGSWSDATVVGTHYKTPGTPIWVLHGGNHYTVLMARSKGLLKLPEPTSAEKKHDVESQRIRRHRRVPSGGMEGEFLLHRQPQYSLNAALIQH